MTDIILLDGADSAQLPAHIRERASQAVALNQAAAAGISAGAVDRLSVRASRFRTIIGGTETVIQSFTLDVVVCLANPHITKAFYEEGYDPDDIKAPDCASSDGIKPDVSIAEPCHHECKSCPKNQFGSAVNPETGAETKACSDSKVLAVVSYDSSGTLGDTVLRFPLAIMSAKNWRKYVDKLTGANVAYPWVVTRLSFEDNTSYPCVKFEPVKWLTAEEIATVTELGESDKAKIATYTNDGGMITSAAPAKPEHAGSTENATDQVPERKTDNPNPKALEEDTPSTEPAGKGSTDKSPPRKAPRKSETKAEPQKVLVPTDALNELGLTLDEMRNPSDPEDEPWTDDEMIAQGYAEWQTVEPEKPSKPPKPRKPAPPTKEPEKSEAPEEAGDSGAITINSVDDLDALMDGWDAS